MSGIESKCDASIVDDGMADCRGRLKSQWLSEGLLNVLSLRTDMRAVGLV